jgi:hypothetical protein
MEGARWWAPPPRLILIEQYAVCIACARLPARIVALAEIAALHLHPAGIDQPLQRALNRGATAIELGGHLHLTAPAPAHVIGVAAKQANHSKY